MEAKRYKINTVQDMVNCTNMGNLEAFLVDLEGFLTTAHAFKAACKMLGETESEKEVGADGFTWIDDEA